VTPEIKIEYLAPEALAPNPWNSNSVGIEMQARLKASLVEFGFVKPIIGRALKDGTIQILGGEHRVAAAIELGMASIPVVILKDISDKRAKALGLADNGRYGEDDALKLSAILGDIGAEMLELLPFDEKDLAGIFSSSSIDLDELGFDDDAPVGDLPPADAPRASITHELMRFKVPVEDRDRVEKFIQHIIKANGFSAESDSMVAAGMALVVAINAAKEVI
jgi:ParB-like chromosome segregation protein Spo0J